MILNENFMFSDITGYILVNLPLEPHSNRQIAKIRKSFNEVRQSQFAFFLLYVAQRRYDFLTKILPQCLIRLLFNFLSKRFTVSITKLADGCTRTNHPEFGAMLWEDKILDIIYFTPPQSNISKNLQNYFSQKNISNLNINRCFINNSTIRTAHSSSCYD